MSTACKIWVERLAKENLGNRYFLVDFVHDEWQTECKGSRELAEYIGQVQCEALQETGKILKLNCPMDGEYTIGKDWSETH